MGPSVILTLSKELDLREQHGLLLKSSSGIMPDACVVFGCSRTADPPEMRNVGNAKCRFANSGVTDQEGGFQNPGVCLQAFSSFLSHPLPALSLAPLFSRSLTLVPRSFLLNRTETLATQASSIIILFLIA